MKWSIAQWCEKQWWKLYLRNKLIEEYLVWKKKYWHNFLTKHTSFYAENNAKNVLDAGCGPAGVFIELSNVRAVTAIDPLLNYYSNSIKHFNPELYPNVQFINTSIENYVAETAHDIVFCLNAINHVEDLSKSIRTLYNSMQLNATLYISVDAHNYNVLKKIFQMFPGDVLHPHQFSLEEYANLLKENNFYIKNISNIHKELIFSYYLIEAIKK